jgi:hypothetical protein
MSKSTTIYVGLDVHKDSVDIATCGAARAAKPEHLGTVGGGLEPVTKALRRLVSRGLRPHIVYEAGPCGFVLQRHLAALGWDCEVIAPSSIVKAPGERVKTDRRDAIKLARLASQGLLTAPQASAWNDQFGFNSSSLGMELDANCARHFEYGRKTGVAVLAQGLVQALSTEACVARDLSHSFSARNVAERARDPGGVLGRFLKPGVEVRRHFLRGSELLRHVIRDGTCPRLHACLWL